MNRRLASITFASAFGLLSVNAHAALIDFDSLSSGDVVGSHYSGLGVTFEKAKVRSISLTGLSAPNVINHAEDGFQISPLNPIEAIFDSPMSSVGVRGLDVGTDGVLLQAFDATTGGTLVGSSQATGTGVGIDQFFDLSVTGGGIKRVTMSHIADNSGEGIAFDNFSFSTGVSVPAPSTILIFGAGLAALGVGRRKFD